MTMRVLEFLTVVVLCVYVALMAASSMERREHTFKVYDANGNTVTCMEIDRGTSH